MSEYINEYLLVYHKIYAEKQTSKHYSHLEGAQILKSFLKVVGGTEAQNILAAKLQRQTFLVPQGSVMELRSFCYFKPVLGDAAIYLN